MYNFESDSSLIIYVSLRNRQKAPLRFIFDNITRSVRAEAAGALAYSSHVYPFNAQFPYNLTLRSKRNFAKSFPAAASREAGASGTPTSEFPRSNAGPN